MRTHLLRRHQPKAPLPATLASIHNERFIVRMVDTARETIASGEYFQYRDEFLGRYYA